MSDIDPVKIADIWEEEHGSLNNITDGFEAAEFATRIAQSEAARLIDKALKESTTDSGKVSRLIRLSERLKEASSWTTKKQ